MKIYIQKILILGILSYFATSCTQSKSTNNNSAANGSITINGQSVLANCTKAVNTNLSASISTITDQNGQIDTQWIKFKFNVISPNLTKSGMTMRFYRMKGVLNDAVMDQNPLQSQTYDMTTGQANSNLVQAASTQSIVNQTGFYIYLNDTQSQYQILKVAFFDTTGKVVENFNILIPEFLASFTEYQINTDGTVRAQYLQDLHPLKNIATTNWSADTYKQFFQQYCF